MKYLLLLLLSTFFLSNLPAQVGINNPVPSQALDVGGKIKVGDDQIAPVAGTIRYNRVAKTFEGYDGTEWSVFNPDPEDGGGNVPASGTVVMSLEVFNSGQGRTATLRGTDGSAPFTTVPAGRTLYITSVIASSNFESTYSISLLPHDGSQSMGYQQIILNSSSLGESIILNDAGGHLMIVPAGGKIDLITFGTRSKVHIRGFLQ
ncbi:hypothetical protein [Neolewinella persica]|uniref:hypothetical protein n=1 Tax=Neolewinella persica TaxID=70998 RepID=UPI000360607A|nr:hypothetical protein [Neolewinella persica]